MTKAPETSTNHQEKAGEVCKEEQEQIANELLSFFNYLGDLLVDAYLGEFKQEK